MAGYKTQAFAVCWYRTRLWRGNRAAVGYTYSNNALIEEGVDEGAAVEGDDVFEFFADAGVDDREFEFGGDGEDYAAFGGAVEFGEDDAGDVGGFGEEAGFVEGGSCLLRGPLVECLV